MRLVKLPLILSLLAALIFSSSVLADANEPSLHEVYQKIAAGQYAQADAMMKEVLENHPNSAKAHYIVAELRLQEGRLDEGRAELARAEVLAPGLPFAQADAVQKLRTQLGKSSALAAGSSSANSIFSNPIFWLLILVLVGGVMYFMKLRKREQANAVALGNGPQSSSAPNPTGGPPNGPGGPGSPNGPAGAPNTGFGGSGLMGSLATGAALGAGMVAGQALASHLMGGEHGNRDASGDMQPPQSGRENTDFGVRDVSTWDDSAGSGNADWDDSGSGNFMDDV